MPDYGFELAQWQHDTEEPPYIEPKALGRCDGCGSPLYSGDTAWRFGDYLFCEECVSNAREEVGACSTIK